MGEAALTRLSDLVDAIREAILPWLDRPFALFGHSMGALLSFELTEHSPPRATRSPTS